MRGDARGDPLAGLDRDGEGGPERRLVALGHRLQTEFVAALLGQAEADQPAAVRCHEVDRLGRRELSGDRQVALVLAVLGVADDDHLPGADVLERVLDRAERRAHRFTASFSTYLASTSTSRFTTRPGPASPSVVRSSVSGMSETVNPVSSTEATVSETPSTAIEPFSTR